MAEGLPSKQDTAAADSIVTRAVVGLRRARGGKIARLRREDGVGFKIDRDDRGLRRRCESKQASRRRDDQAPLCRARNRLHAGKWKRPLTACGSEWLAIRIGRNG